MAEKKITGRFAPSPSGRMHLGNIFTALLSWLSAKSKGGEWLLRIEDLDPQRSKMDHARMIEDDLHWLGLEWDRGGIDGKGPDGPYMQSRRHSFYEDALRTLRDMGITYPCVCTRAEILATQAPHQSDGRVVYGGRCRPEAILSRNGGKTVSPLWEVPHAERLYVRPGTISFQDTVCGPQEVDLAGECGDFILRRADGAWAYQLAVVVDDATMGVTEVVRGNDLLLSAAQQLYLYDLLGFPAPEFIHVPLICNTEGRRLSKRDNSLAMDALRARFSPRGLIGRLAFLAGLTEAPDPSSPEELIALYKPERLSHIPAIRTDSDALPVA